MTTARFGRRESGRQLRTAARSGDSGLTLIELMVALMVAFVALTVLAGVFIGALHTLTVAKQRQSATALGNRAMEQVRALPFSAITSGVSINDLAGDPNISGSPARLRPTAASTVDEVLQTNGAAIPPSTSLPLCKDLATPLLPHRCTTTLDGVDYTVSTYVSQVPGATPVQYSLSTIVTWSSKATRDRTKTIVNRSRAFSPNGTCSPANHPFNTPCQSQYHAHAGLSEGGVTLTALTDGAPIAAGFPVVSAELSLPRLNSTTAVEQTVTVSGATGAHSARILHSDGTAPQTSGVQALSSAATDPSNSALVQPTAMAPVAPAIDDSGAGWDVTVSPETAGSWSSTSRSSAGANSGCRDALGAAVDGTGQPCGSSSNLQQTGEASLTVQPAAILGRQLGRLQLASFGLPPTFGSPPASAYAFGARFVAPHPTWCPSAGGFGCVAAGARRELGTTVIGELPAALAGDSRPALFQGAVRLTGHTSSVSTASGVGAAPPTVTRSGTLEVWNGTGYVSHVLDSSGTTLPVDVVATYLAPGGGQLTAKVTGTVTVGATSTSPGSCVSALCEASTGSVVTDLTYDISHAGVTQAGFRVRADLGTLLAKTSFKAA